MKKLFLISLMLITFFSVQAQWEIEGINDTKGEYKNNKTGEMWSIYFSDTQSQFVALYSWSFEGEDYYDEELVIDRVEKISKGFYKIHMEGISGEMVPAWWLKYDNDKGFYNLQTYSYDALDDMWLDKHYKGNSNN